MNHTLAGYLSISFVQKTSTPARLSPAHFLKGNDMKSLAVFTLLALSTLTFPAAAHASSWETYEPGPVTQEDKMFQDQGPEQVKSLNLNDIPMLNGTGARTNASPKTA